MSKYSREADKVISKISNLLSTGKLKADDKLPTEAQLCTEFNISRTVVREALQQLKAIGVLHTITGSGSYVSDGSLKGMQNSLEFFAVMTGDTDSWIELLDIRSLLESACARKLAGEAFSESSLAAIKAAHTKMSQNKDDLTAFAEADLKLHQVLIKESGNKISAAILDSLKNLQLRFSKETYRDENSEQLIVRNLKEHAAIIDAIESKDPDAAEKAMKIHISATKDNLLHYIAKNS